MVFHASMQKIKNRFLHMDSKAWLSKAGVAPGSLTA